MRVLYVSGSRGREREMLAAAPGISFIEVSIHLRRDVGIPLVGKLRQLLSAMRRFRPDVVLVERPGVASLPALFACKLFGARLAVRVKGDLWREYEEAGKNLPAGEKIIKVLNYMSSVLMLKGACCTLPISRRLLERARVELGGAKPVQVVHIPYVRRKASAGEPVPERGFVLTVTNFNFWGKVEPLVEAAPMVRGVLEALGLDWVILGDGFFLEMCRARLEGHGGRVKVMGRRDAAAYYSAALFQLYISGMDGLPNVLLEGAAAGLPAVINHDSPAAEFVEEGCSGYRVDFADASEVERVFRLIAGDEEHRAALGECARRYVLENFSPERTGAELEAALEECIAG